MSDFFPAYLTPRGIAMMTAARKENPRNHNRKKKSFPPRKTGIKAKYGNVVKKQSDSVRVFP